MKSTQYLKQPTAGGYDAWAVWTRERGEFICCGEPRQLQLRGMTVLCTSQQRLEQINRANEFERGVLRALINYSE